MEERDRQRRAMFVPTHNFPTYPHFYTVPRPPVYFGNPRFFPMSTDQDLLARIEGGRSLSLMQLMIDMGVIPSEEDAAKRESITDRLKMIVMDWIKKVAYKNHLPRRYASIASATILTYGSYGLSVHTPDSDIDAVCVGPRFATMEDDFFNVLHDMLACLKEVSDIHCIKDAKVPLMRFKFDGISIDLPYAQLQVMSVPENADILDPFFSRDIEENSWRTLSGVRANKSILQLVPNVELFRAMLRCVKLWAKRRGVYGHLFGFFGGVHLAILAAFISLTHPNVGLSGAVAAFFQTFGNWHWPIPVTLYAEPIPSTDRLRPDFDWKTLFQQFPYTSTYNRFIQLRISASDQEKLGNWMGWVKSRFRFLLLKLEVNAMCDPNPSEYFDTNLQEPNVVFYWGLHPDQIGNYVDIDSVREEFRRKLSNGYQGPLGELTLSIVEASQVPRNPEC